jgi:hypothetical protein
MNVIFSRLDTVSRLIIEMSSKRDLCAPLLWIIVGGSASVVTESTSLNARITEIRRCSVGSSNGVSD